MFTFLRKVFRPAFPALLSPSCEFIQYLGFKYGLQMLIYSPGISSELQTCTYNCLLDVSNTSTWYLNFNIFETNSLPSLSPIISCQPLSLQTYTQGPPFTSFRSNFYYFLSFAPNTEFICKAYRFYLHKRKYSKSTYFFVYCHHPIQPTITSCPKALLLPPNHLPASTLATVHSSLFTAINIFKCQSYYTYFPAWNSSLVFPICLDTIQTPHSGL